MDPIQVAIALALLSAGCDRGQPLSVTNVDSVELTVELRTSDDTLDWRRTITPGATASLRAHVSGEASIITTVRLDDRIVQQREKGYLSASLAQDRTCISVSRQQILVSSCE